MSVALPNPHSYSLRETSSGQGLAPASWQGFACYGVNVTGPGIADSSLNPKPNPDVSSLIAGTTSCAYRGVVSNGITFAIGQTEALIDLQVPPGSSRVIQLVGITNSAFCGANFLDNSLAGSPGAYEIGRSVVDLFGDATVSINVSYLASESKRVDCGGSSSTILAVGFSSPGAGAYANAANQSSFPVSGTCSEEGQAVNLKANSNPVVGAFTCASGHWSGTIDLSNGTTFPNGAITLTADHSRSDGTPAPTASVLISKDTVPPSGATALVWGAVSPSTTRSLVATWTNTDPALFDQMVQFYSDGACGTASGSAISSGTNKTLAFTAPADGSFSYKVTSFDGAGNSAPSGCSSAMIVDTVAPAAASALVWTQTSPFNSYAVTASWTRSVSADLANQKIQFYADGTCTAASGSLIDLASSALATSGFTAPAEGTYSYKLTSIDTAGNSTVSACSSPMVVDVTVPTVAITAPAAASYVNLANKTAFAVSGTCSENGRPVVISGAVSTSTTCAAGAWSVILDFSAAPDGAVSVIADHQDAALNSAATASRSFTKDVVAPTVAITSPAANAYVNLSNVAAFTVSGTCSENGRNVVLSGAASVTASCTAGAWSVSLDLSAAAQGALTINADLTDVAGNTAAQASRGFLKDTIAPATPTVTSPIAGYIYNTLSEGMSANVQGTCAEAGGNVVVNSGLASGTCNGSTYTVPTSLSGFGDGAVALNVTVADAAGNLSAPASVNFTKESTYFFALQSAQMTVRNPVFVFRGAQAGDRVRLVANSDAACAGGAERYVGAIPVATNGAVTVTAAESYAAAPTESYRAQLVRGGNPVYCATTPVTYNFKLMTGINAVSAGEDFTCALTSTGAVVCAGGNGFGQLGNGSNQASPILVTAIPSGATAVSAFGFNACAVVGGSAKCWGSNNVGQLGNGTTANSNVPVPVSGLAAGVTAISTGTTHACAVVGGAVKCWGSNAYGELGDGTTINSNVPVTVPGITTATSVAVGATHSCVLLSSMSVQCWGRNLNGQLGNGGTTDSLSPVTPSSLGTASALVAGASHTCAISGGYVKCWGSNSDGQIGGGTIGTNSLVPVSVTPVSSPIAVAAGWNTTCAVASAGNVRCWGANKNGQLGDGGLVGTVSPSSPPGSGITAVAVGTGHVCARSGTGNVTCWGSNSAGQFGNGILDSRQIPQMVNPSDTYVEIASGRDFTCGRTTAGAVKCWGDNSSGALGSGSTAPVVGTTMPISSGATRVSAGDAHVCAIVSGNLNCWGENYNGQVGNGATGAAVATPYVTLGGSVTDVDAGGSHTCAIQASSLKCWGGNSNGQLGNGTTTNQLNPVTLSLGFTPVKVASGGDHTCAMDAVGALKCWGLNNNGQVGDGTNGTSRLVPTSVAGVASGASLIANAGGHTCAMIAGDLKCWGDNSGGQFGNGGSLSVNNTPVLTLAAASTLDELGLGLGYTCALFNYPGSGDVKCAGTNDLGQLGAGIAAISSNTFVGVGGLSGIASLGAGLDHACAVDLNGKAWCWGSNKTRQVATPWETLPSYMLDPVP